MQIAFNKGSSPDVNKKDNNPRLRNMYFSESGTLNRLPSLDIIDAIKNIIGVYKSTTGVYYVATSTQLLSIDSKGSVNAIGQIKTNGVIARFAENQANQIILVTGSAAYIYLSEQENPFRQLGTDEQFDIKNPIDVVVINTLAVIIGGDDKKWTVSDANNVTVFNVNDIAISDATIGNLVACEEYEDDLFIFGQYGTQRWTPSLERTQYDFPFSLSTSFKEPIGAINTMSVQKGKDGIYFLSSSFVIMKFSSSGFSKICSLGIAREIKDYQDKLNSYGSIYTFSGNDFYQLSFLKDENAYVYCSNTGVMSESDDMIIGATNSIEQGSSVVITNDSINNLIEANTDKECLFDSYVINDNGNTDFSRTSVEAIRLDVSQGLPQEKSPQYVELALSKDNVLWGNSVRRQLGRVGQRQATLTWRPGNFSCKQLSVRIRYYGNLNISMKRLFVNFK